MKVSAVKSLSIDIGHEIREQKKLLDDMDNDFDRTGGFLNATVDRVGRMLKAGYNRYIFYLILFSLFVFFCIWVIVRFR
ncbi:protein transport protein bet1 [Chamberlinius hualienensis]